MTARTNTDVEHRTVSQSRGADLGRVLLSSLGVNSGRQRIDTYPEGQRDSGDCVDARIRNSTAFYAADRVDAGAARPAKLFARKPSFVTFCTHVMAELTSKRTPSIIGS